MPHCALLTLTHKFGLSASKYVQFLNFGKIFNRCDGWSFYFNLIQSHLLSLRLQREKYQTTVCNEATVFLKVKFVFKLEYIT